MKVFRIFVDGKNGTMLYKNSVVKNPAHGKMKLSFAEDTVQIDFDDVKQNIVGVAIAPEVQIFRKHNKIGNHYVVFGKQDIEQMAYLYGKKKFWNNLTFNHSDKEPVKSATMYLSYIIDRKNGMSAPKAFKDEVDGTWLLGYHFEDKAEYEYARDNFAGWSVEGEFYMEEINQNPIKMSKPKTKFAALFEKISNLVKEAFGSVTATDGTVIEYEGETLEVGVAVFVTDADGAKVPAPDGEHTLEDGRMIVVAEGLVTEVKEAEVETSSEVTTEDMNAMVEAMEKFAEVIKTQFETIEKQNERIAKLEQAPAAKPEKKKFEREKLDSTIEFLMRKTK